MVQTPLPQFSSLPARLIGNVKATLTSIILFSTLLLTNVAQMLSLIVWPFSKRAFRRWNRECANAWWDLSRWWTEDLYKIDIKIVGD